jgi:hypothetical protein
MRVLGLGFLTAVKRRVDGPPNQESAPCVDLLKLRHITTMSRAPDYRKHAEECRSYAGNLQAPQSDTWLRAAEEWERKAQEEGQGAQRGQLAAQPGAVPPEEPEKQLNRSSLAINRAQNRDTNQVLARRSPVSAVRLGSSLRSSQAAASSSRIRAAATPVRYGGSLGGLNR